MPGLQRPAAKRVSVQRRVLLFAKNAVAQLNLCMHCKRCDAGWLNRS